ncbi:MAG TPA: 3-isopropylmalate dehydratase small subunit [Stellaceae bacterium]|jgi:3-isopropylmalate/(R)-2-methylmalate dehydratase small subunit|nr:3-isopropylmalate dehydratase small subunit [Stellaceae bacterium]
MKKFTTWTSVAAPFDASNIDTNQLCPTRFNKVARGPDYAKVLLHDLRFDITGTHKTDYFLNTPPYDKAGIFVADRNFGCGSSRESAVYALEAFGVRSIIAVSFGEIFFTNCLKNSILPVALSEEACAEIRRQLHAKPGAEITVDLARQVVRDVEGKEHHFDLHPLRKRCLLDGLDDISLTFQYEKLMQSFEAGYNAEFPWLIKPENQPPASTPKA